AAQQWKEAGEAQRDHPSAIVNAGPKPAARSAKQPYPLVVTQSASVQFALESHQIISCGRASYTVAPGEVRCKRSADIGAGFTQPEWRKFRSKVIQLFVVSGDPFERVSHAGGLKDPSA